MTLEENDLIMTGTPKGLSHIYPGDLMRLEVEGWGCWRTRLWRRRRRGGGTDSALRCDSAQNDS